MKMETVRENNLGINFWAIVYCKSAKFLIIEFINFLGAVLVQKIAYCDTHAPADPVNKARMQALGKKKENTPSPNDKMKNARRLLAKKRSVAPVISIPTIPPERFVF